MTTKRKIIDLDIRKQIAEEIGKGKKAIDISVSFGVNINTILGYKLKIRKRGTIFMSINGRPKGSKGRPKDSKKESKSKKVCKLT